MKKILMTIAIAGALTACNSDQGGVVNDGTRAIDTNGGLADTPYNYKPKTDTSKMENRVDLSKRDTFDNNPKK